MNIRTAEINKGGGLIRVGDAESYRRLIRSRSAPNVQNQPDIRQLKVRRRVAVTQAQNASAEDLFVVASRSLDVGDGEKLRDADPLSRRHLIALLFDFYGVHCRLLSIPSLSTDSKCGDRRTRGPLKPDFGLSGPLGHPLVTHHSLVTQPRTPKSNPFHLLLSLPAAPS